jgi:hypothetical protein
MWWLLLAALVGVNADRIVPDPPDLPDEMNPPVPESTDRPDDDPAQAA